ncbi:MAG: ABC transporter ATP-binding protein [Thermomicrobiales bacterium]|nr:ABC transporter ATP-binding protein [Thermomicrobiales bacterium]
MLEVTDLEAGYAQRPVLKGISFHVGDGEVASILGANGAGKTTTLRTLVGLLPARRGHVRFEEREITRLAPHRLVRLGIAMVPEGRQIFSRLTVLENLRLGAYIYDAAARIDADLERVFDLFPRLRERSAQDGGSLSGGEQQMLAMGRAMMSRPRLLLLDEPSMGLAPLMVERIYEIVSRINEQGTSVLLVEQNARMALRVSRHAYVMETGALVFDGEADALLQDDRIRRAYLGES